MCNEMHQSRFRYCSRRNVQQHCSIVPIFSGPSTRFGYEQSRRGLGHPAAVGKLRVAGRSVKKESNQQKLLSLSLLCTNAEPSETIDTFGSARLFFCMKLAMSCNPRDSPGYRHRQSRRGVGRRASPTMVSMTATPRSPCSTSWWCSRMAIC